MIPTKLTREEMETHIYVDDLSDFAEVYTTIPKDIRKLTRLNWEVVKTDYYSNGTVMAVTFKAPKKMVAYRRNNIDRPKRIPNSKGLEALKMYRENKAKA